jgi:hypothetical protein
VQPSPTRHDAEYQQACAEHRIRLRFRNDDEKAIDLAAGKCLGMHIEVRRLVVETIDERRARSGNAAVGGDKNECARTCWGRAAR